MCVKDLSQIQRAAQNKGWRIVKTNGGHWKWIWRTGVSFFSASTPSDHRAIKNIESRIRRIEQGLPVR